MNQSKRWWEIAGIALGILLLVAVTRTLLTVQPPATNTPPETVLVLKTQPVATNTPQVAVETTTLPAATKTQSATAPVTQAAIIPLCIFPIFTQMAPAAARLTYTLSEPRVVLTSETLLDIAGWLPDGERLLLVRDAEMGRKIIETFNVNNKEHYVYAKRHGSNGAPIWIEDIDAVAYSTIVGDHYELWLSAGNPDETNVIATSVNGESLATNGVQLVYFAREQNWDRLQLWDATTREAAQELLDMSQVFTPTTSSMIDLKPPQGRMFHATWQPAGDHIAFYGYTRLMLLNTQTDQLCQVNLENLDGREHTVVYARWSPDGRYLAIMGSLYIPNLQRSLIKDLTILDMTTGDLHSMHSDAAHIESVDWFNDSQTLIMLGLMEEELDKGRAQHRLFVGNIADDSLQSVLPNYFFGTGSGKGWLLSSSPTKNEIAIKCSVWVETQAAILEDRLCLIDASSKP